MRSLLSQMALCAVACESVTAKEKSSSDLSAIDNSRGTDSTEQEKVHEAPDAPGFEQPETELDA